MARYFGVPEEEVKPKAIYDAEIILGYLDNMQEAVDNLDMDKMDKVIGLLEQVALEERETQCFVKMREAVEELDAESCEELIKEWRQLIHM